MKRRVILKQIIEVEFDDEEMREYGYEGEITDAMREEYFGRLLEDEYLEKPLSMYDEVEIIKLSNN